MIPWLGAEPGFPPDERALREPNGLLAAGGALTPAWLLAAYRRGIFPWFSEGQPVLWWTTDPRMVLPVSAFKLSRSLRKTIQKFRRTPGCEVRVDHAFSQVMAACAHTPREGQDGTWIVPDMVAAYTALHRAGFAHSVETWIDGELVGGLYCVAVGKAVFGESMFARRTDASKIALAALVAFCRQHDIPQVDCQQNTGHLATLGAAEMPRQAFLEVVQAQQTAPAPRWTFEPLYWKQVLASPAHPDPSA